MNRLLITLLLTLLISCNDKSKAVKYKSHCQVIELVNPTVLVIELDATEIERAKSLGEDDFYTAADDEMWYYSELAKKMDSLKIPMIHSKNDKLEIRCKKLSFIIAKDTNSIYTYYYFDGKSVQSRDVFDLLEE